MPTLILDDKTAAAFLMLRDSAMQSSVSLARLLEETAMRLSEAATEGDSASAPVDQWLQELNTLAKESDHLPGLPTDFSRDDMYHDPLA